MPERFPGLGTRPNRKTGVKAVGVCPVNARVCYASRSAAKQDAKKIVASGKEDRSPGRDLQEYRCKTCGHWHIGH